MSTRSEKLELDTLQACVTTAQAYYDAGHFAKARRYVETARQHYAEFVEQGFSEKANSKALRLIAEGELLYYKTLLKQAKPQFELDKQCRRSERTVAIAAGMPWIRMARLVNGGQAANDEDDATYGRPS